MVYILLVNEIKWFYFVERDCGEKALEIRERLCICGSRGIDGFGTDVGSNFREVDNEISIRWKF